jgi:hypothetical protein
MVEHHVHRCAVRFDVLLGERELFERIADLQRDVVHPDTGVGRDRCALTDFDQRDVVVRVAGRKERHGSLAKIASRHFLQPEHPAVEAECAVEVLDFQHDVSDLGDTDS